MFGEIDVKKKGEGERRVLKYRTTTTARRRRMALRSKDEKNVKKYSLVTSRAISSPE